jgi:hypothetical protein
MLIHIAPDELIEEFKNSWKLGYITQPSIDYADNALYAIFENKLVTIFRFNKFGIYLDNRFNGYQISYGLAGITIILT